MDFNSAIGSLTDGFAAKVPSFSGGYVKRTDYEKTEHDTWDSKFDIVFVTQAHGSSAPSSFTFTVTVTGASRVTTGPASGLVLDPQLFNAVLFSTDWIVGPSSDFETARTESGQVW